jgi:very-short-patch-repair endonuclease
MEEFLDSLGVEYIHSDWSILEKYELDFYIPSHNLAIEFDGIYWHSEIHGKDKNYHLDKTKKCSEKDIKLLHIFENELVNKKDIWKSIFKGKLGLMKECMLENVFLSK